MKKDLLVVFVLLVAVLLTGCSKSSQKSSMPPKAPKNSIDSLGESFSKGVLPGMVRVISGTVNTAGEAYAGLKNCFKEYSQSVECYTEIDGFYVFSIKPEKSEDIKKSKCSFSPMIYVKKGSGSYRYWWPVK